MKPAEHHPESDMQSRAGNGQQRPATASNGTQHPAPRNPPSKATRGKERKRRRKGTCIAHCCRGLPLPRPDHWPSSRRSI
eukprot:3200623-Rhodomonas_salina.1